MHHIGYPDLFLQFKEVLTNIAMSVGRSRVAENFTNKSQYFWQASLVR